MCNGTDFCNNEEIWNKRKVDARVLMNDSRYWWSMDYNIFLSTVFHKNWKHKETKLCWGQWHFYLEN
jgi:hypothetical protein